MDFVKEAARLGVAAMISYLLTGVVLSNLLDVTIGRYLAPDLILELAAVLTVVLKALDRYLHETAKADTQQEKGLFQF